MKFIAVDVETANADMASVCSFGAATFESGKLIDEWYTLIDPEDDFDPVNVSIHGIDDEMVVDAPNYQAVAPTIESILCDNVVVSHTHFDRVSIRQAEQRFGPSHCAAPGSTRRG